MYVERIEARRDYLVAVVFRATGPEGSEDDPSEVFGKLFRAWRNQQRIRLAVDLVEVDGARAIAEAVRNGEPVRAAGEASRTPAGCTGDPHGNTDRSSGREGWQPPAIT